MNAILLKVATLNILNDPLLWEQRCGLILNEFARLQPDLIGLQEVALPEDNARRLAEALGMEYFLAPKTGPESEREGLAILSRLPVEEHSLLDLGSQQRVAQRVRVRLNGQEVTFANGHFYWYPGPSSERVQQVERLLAWLAPHEGRSLVVAGDFNALPNFPALEVMRRRFVSAFAAANGFEAEYTFPTPLERSAWKKLRSALHLLFRSKLEGLQVWKWGTLDYIFTSRTIGVQSCTLAFNNPHPENPKIFASDHFGLFAELQISAHHLSSNGE